MPLHSKPKLIFKLNDPEYRKAFVSSRIDNGLAFQIRVMRQSKAWSQAEFAKKLGTSQNAVFRIENPAYGKQSLTTLKKIAEIFDVGLIVRFAPFSQLVDLTTSISTDDLLVPSVAEDQALKS
jgi:transcriptional regulator with XRE-family HTH domain